MYLTEEPPNNKVNTMQFSQFVASEGSNTELQEKKKNTRLGQEKKNKPEPSTGTLRRRKLGKNKVMKGNTFPFSYGFCEDLASMSQCKLDSTVTTISPTSYFSLLQFVANADKEWMAGICKAMYLCPDGTFPRYDAVSLILQASMIP